MSFLKSMIFVFDAVALRLTGLDSDKELSKRAKEFSHDGTPKRIYEAYDSVDTKAAAVLQHVSIMIAVSGILFAEASQRILKNIFVGELVFYICLAISCLRLLMNEPIKANQSANVAAKEGLLDLTAKVTFLVSIVLIITVIAEVLVIYVKASK